MDLHHFVELFMMISAVSFCKCAYVHEILLDSCSLRSSGCGINYSVSITTHEKYH